MRVHDLPRLIALTLMAASTGGCGWFFGCGPDRSSEMPLSVSDWAVTTERYTGIQKAADDWTDGPGFESTDDSGGLMMVWEELGEDLQCHVACAYVLDELDNFHPEYTDYFDLIIHSCELAIPTAEGDGSLSCTATLKFNDYCVGGRRPRAWLAERAPITCVQQQLDGMAEMEHVSITAFIELAAQLEAHRAPAALVARCRAAADDERRHVALLVELGAEPPSNVLEPTAASLIEIALHNAVEGCVTETWAALLARHQSEHAADPSVRRAFEQIAADEARHAQLAWELHAWFVEVLDPAAAVEVEAARAQALARLVSWASQQSLAVPRAVREALGLPDPRLASTLASDFGRRLAA
jgi:hypothetical protein